jgi:hypothetical protein
MITKYEGSNIHKYFHWFYSLPVIEKIVGIYDRYNKGKAVNLIFNGEHTIVWIEYKTKTKAYRYKY